MQPKSTMLNVLTPFLQLCLLLHTTLRLIATVLSSILWYLWAVRESYANWSDCCLRTVFQSTVTKFDIRFWILFTWKSFRSAEEVPSWLGKVQRLHQLYSTKLRLWCPNSRAERLSIQPSKHADDEQTGTLLTHVFITHLCMTHVCVHDWCIFEPCVYDLCMYNACMHESCMYDWCIHDL